jgi:tRNA A-37 threonylcarbamoyl transferase component Bud32
MQDIDWHFASPCPALEDGSWQDQATRVKTNRKRDVYQTERLFIKVNRQTAWKDKLKKIVRCKALEEFNALRALSKAGITAVRPIAWGESAECTYLATEAWLPSEMVEDVLRTLAPEDEPAFFSTLAAFLCELRNKQVYHPDLHGGNILCRRGSEGYEFCAVDTIGVRIREELPRNEIDELFLWIAPILSERPAAFAAFADSPAPGEQAPEAWLRGLMREVDRKMLRRLPGKIRRFGEAGRVCREHRDVHGSWLIRSEEDPAALAEVVAEFAELADDAFVKLGSKRVVARVGGYIVKRFLGQAWRPTLLRRDRGAWFNAAGFETLGFPSARGLAWIRMGPQAGVVIYEDVGNDCLHDLLQSEDGEVRKRWLSEAAELMASLHRAEVFHADLKTSNHIYTPDLDRLSLIDCDSATFGKVVSLERRARNLASLIETVPETVDAAEIADFLACYMQAFGERNADKLREALKKRDVL